VDTVLAPDKMPAALLASTSNRHVLAAVPALPHAASG
jgi:hypothetical protein